jgi:hypothetical protein
MVKEQVTEQQAEQQSVPEDQKMYQMDESLRKEVLEFINVEKNPEIQFKTNNDVQLHSYFLTVLSGGYESYSLQFLNSLATYLSEFKFKNVYQIMQKLSLDSGLLKENNK